MKVQKKPFVTTSNKARILKELSNNETPHHFSTQESVKRTRSKEKHSKDSRMSKVWLKLVWLKLTLKLHQNWIERFIKSLRCLVSKLTNRSSSLFSKYLGFKVRFKLATACDRDRSVILSLIVGNINEISGERPARHVYGVKLTNNGLISPFGE
jgi:hypothetical protein